MTHATINNTITINAKKSKTTASVASSEVSELSLCERDRHRELLQALCPVRHKVV